MGLISLQSLCLFAPGVLREYAQIHPNRSTCEPKDRIEACMGFFFHYMMQRQFFCYFQVFRLVLSTK